MKVSIIVAAYNIENYVARCLESCVNQKLSELEVIVVNDGSTDSTLCQIECFAKKDKRIKIINKENEGLIEARKSGIQKARGEYILFIDGDDWLELDALEVLYNKATTLKSDIVVYNCFKSYENGIKEIYNIFPSNIKTDTDYLSLLFLDEILPSIWSKFIRRGYIEEKEIVFPSNINYAEDLATVIALFMNNPKVIFEEKALYNYYQRSNSISNEVSSKILELDVAFKYIEINLNQKGIQNKYKEEFEYLIYLKLMKQSFLGKYYKNQEIGKKLYNIYISKNIDIYVNNYFLNKKRDMSKYEIIRLRVYLFSYKSGNLLDKVRFITESIIRRT